MSGNDAQNIVKEIRQTLFGKKKKKTTPGTLKCLKLKEHPIRSAAL